VHIVDRDFCKSRESTVDPGDLEVYFILQLLIVLHILSRRHSNNDELGVLLSARIVFKIPLDGLKLLGYALGIVNLSTDSTRFLPSNSSSYFCRCSLKLSLWRASAKPFQLMPIGYTPILVRCPSESM